jgi:catechol 2,3-dioxygenase-like lactoylglutathione lyase family enzyme
MAGMRPILTHVALHVRDIEASLAFYRAYCGLEVIHDRGGEGAKRVVWLAGPEKAAGAVIVLLAGGPGREQDFGRDFSHIGFALDSREAVEAVARRAKAEGRLVWPVRDDAFPAGSYCGVRDPDGNAVEFSYGQPLGPGAEGAKSLSRSRI